MMNKVIFDTNFLVALMDNKDKFHSKAEEIYNYSVNLETEIFIFDCVIDETINVFSKRCSEQKREEEFEKVLDKTLDFINKNSIIWVYFYVKDLFDKIIQTIRLTKGKLNFHDVLIVEATRKLNLKYIASFDEDFDKVEDLCRIKSKNDLEIIYESD